MRGLNSFIITFLDIVCIIARRPQLNLIIRVVETERVGSPLALLSGAGHGGLEALVDRLIVSGGPLDCSSLGLSLLIDEALRKSSESDAALELILDILQ